MEQQWRQRCDDAAKQFVFGMLVHAGLDVFSAASGDQIVDGVIRAEMGGKVRYLDVFVRSAGTWKEISLPFDDLRTDDTIVFAVNWATREILWLPGEALRHPEPDAVHDWQARILFKPSVAELKKNGLMDLSRLRHFITS
jgi:hypothetical protein